MDKATLLYIGTAGWQLPNGSVPSEVEGTHLERYAGVFNAVEINSTFHRPHQPKTFERWAATVPNAFRFAVKMHKGITHTGRLKDIRPAQDFLDMVSALGVKLGPVLVQLPPSLVWGPEAEDFLTALREVHGGALVLEARHPSWALHGPVNMLKANSIAGVAADPPLLTAELQPTGHPVPIYFRLHGSPRMYWSAYADVFLRALASRVAGLLSEGRTVWVIFDNTAAGAATANAQRLQTLVFEQLRT